jgi:hypothetical protein
VTLKSVLTPTTRACYKYFKEEKMLFISPIEVLLTLKPILSKDCRLEVSNMKETSEGESLLSLDLFFSDSSSGKLNGVFRESDVKEAGYPTEIGLFKALMNDDVLQFVSEN